MATEAQRARRRRNRLNKRARQGRATGIRAAYTPGNSSNGRFVGGSLTKPNPGIWYTETFSFVIDALTGNPTNQIWCFPLESATSLRDNLRKTGEYRLLSLRCDYNPINATSDDRVAIAPYFDPINKLERVSNFLANGRQLRKGDSRFAETWNVKSEITSVLDPNAPEPIIGGVCIFYNEGQRPGGPAVINPVNGATGRFLITVGVTFQFRGKKSDLLTYAAT